MDNPNKFPEISQPQDHPPLLFGQRLRTVTIISFIAALLLAGIFFVSLLKSSQPQITLQPFPSPTIPTGARPAAPDAVGENWKTYVNTKYNYQIKYPPEWSIETLYPNDASIEIAEDVELKKFKDQPLDFQGQIIFDILSHPNPKQLSLKEFLLNGDINIYHPLFVDSFTPEGEKASRQREVARMKEVSFKGFEALRYERFKLFVNTGTHIFLFYLESAEPDETTSSSQKQLFDQILSTFKFLDQANSIAYPSKEECERKTGKACSFSMCDYIPPGKTIEEVCGSKARKGWYPSE